MKQLFYKQGAAALMCLALAACGGGSDTVAQLAPTPAPIPAPVPIPAPTPPFVEQPLAFTRIDPQVPSSLKAARTVVISDNATWQALWREHTSRMVVAPPAPVIDFATQTVVVGVAAGCSNPRVSQIVKTASAVEVRYTVFTPGGRDPATPDCQVPTVSNAVFVTFAKLALPVQFVDVSSPTIPFTRVTAQFRSMPDQLTIIGDQAGLEALWKKGTAGQDSPAPIPAIDFSTQSVAASVSTKSGCPTPYKVFQLVRTTNEAQLLYEERFTLPLPLTALCTTSPETSVALMIFAKQTVPVNFVNVDGVNLNPNAYIQDLDPDGSSAVQTDRNVVVTDLAAWQALWNEHTAGVATKQGAPYYGFPYSRDLPSIDFATQSVVAMFRRVPDSCSSRLSIIRTVALADSAEIRYWLGGRSVLSQNCQVRPMTLASFAVIKKTPLKIVFVNIAPALYFPPMTD